MERIDVKECHKYLLNIAKTFHDICVKHNIPYFMLGGTQLGAIRHHGFIPWDDDMDFGVPRQYFAEMIDLLHRELPREYKILDIYHTENFNKGYVKLEDSRTLIKEVSRKGKSMGLNIDIFPLDFTNGKKNIFSKNWLINQLIKVESYTFDDLDNLDILRMSINKIFKVLLFFLNSKSILKYINKHLISSEGDFIVNHFGVYADKEIVKKDFFGVPMLYKFEDTELYGVAKADDYLTHIYGDYMQIPKGRANHFHIQELYLK